MARLDDTGFYATNRKHCCAIRPVIALFAVDVRLQAHKIMREAVNFATALHRAMRAMRELELQADELFNFIGSKSRTIQRPKKSSSFSIDRLENECS
jgi:hypothetical protein